ncbi:type IV pilus biogenesis protein PilP [Methylocaldum sp. BRCS4]|nr:type IV pilus biogenesis protein PilP [Methylocaldum sp. BRCS4]
MKFSNHLVFSRARKSIIATILFVIAPVGQALTPVGPGNASEQSSAPGQVVEPLMPSAPTELVTPEDSQFAKDIERLQQELAVLKLREQKAKLQDEIAKTNAGKAGEGSDTVNATADVSDSEIGIRAIYGVGRSYQAVIYYRGAELAVKQGSDIDGKWKVASITASTVRIRNGKVEKALSLSAPTRAHPVQPSRSGGMPPLGMPPMLGGPSQPPVVTPGT